MHDREAPSEIIKTSAAIHPTNSNTQDTSINKEETQEVAAIVNTENATEIKKPLPLHHRHHPTGSRKKKEDQVQYTLLERA